MIRTLASLAILTVCTLHPAEAQTNAAQTPNTPAAPAAKAGGWEFVVAPYFIAAGMSGNIEVRGITLPVDVSFSSVLENLELGGMFHLEAQKDRFAIFGDVIYMGLGSSGPDQLIKTSIDVDEYVGELGFAYRFGEPGRSVSVIGGARYFKLDAVIRAGNQASVNRGFDFLDPLIGVRFNWAASEKFSLLGRADIAGFGLGSELTINAEAMFGYHLKGNTTLYMGYRVIAVDYEQGGGPDLFLYDVTTGGIMMGAAIRF